MFIGESIRIEILADGVLELIFDRRHDAINKLDLRTVAELAQATARIAAEPSVRGVLITSAKDSFIVGADIKEFGELFACAKDRLIAVNTESNRSFTALETLAVPTVVALNGTALGGGLEMALAADFRVLSKRTMVGLPEVKLGLIPGFGGTVRLPRVIGVDAALRVIVSGTPLKADAALAAGLADGVADEHALREMALAVLMDAMEDRRDWRSRRSAKDAPVSGPKDAMQVQFAAARQEALAQSPKFQPARMAAVELMERSVNLKREAALALEAAAFADIAHTQAAASLVQIFLNDQHLKRLYKEHAKRARPLTLAAVVGAGIMGGGIAYTAALRGTSVLLKDIQQKQLDVGLSEAQKLLAKQVKSGRVSPERADAVLDSITPQLDYENFERVDVVVEAVVENLDVKHAVSTHLETVVRPDTIIASNTSSLRIDDLARPLKRPENFIGMHFFNPVPAMPLVEVIKGTTTSDIAAATVVGFALAMGKTPIVVRDGPGFLVNRILTPYMMASSCLIADGADFAAIDEAMEAFGWPMGPNYLNDVIGMDTGQHVTEIIGAGFAPRMEITWTDSVALMVRQGRLGQKTGAGFYRYEQSATGKPVKSVDVAARALLESAQPKGRSHFMAEEIVERMMLPLILEAARALEDGVVESASELDMALMLGLGLPQYLGGALKYADWLGPSRVVESSDRYAHLGLLYHAPARLREMAAQGLRYY